MQGYSSLSIGDIKSVIQNFVEKMKEQLLEGKSVIFLLSFLSFSDYTVGSGASSSPPPSFPPPPFSPYSSLSIGDIKSVIQNFVEKMKEQLLEGKSVNIEFLRNIFQIDRLT